MATGTKHSLTPAVQCSICIANYNGLDVIDECLQSVLGQEGNVSYEVLVHDDASTDGSADYIAKHYPEAKLIRSETNVGFCIANNRMTAAATGEYFLLLNNDAALYPDALQALYTEASRQQHPAILTLPQYEAVHGMLVDRGLFLDPFLNPVPNHNLSRTEVATVHGACLWLPRSLWNEIGGFPEWFHMLAEDLYICCAARLMGANVRVLPSSGYRHRIGHSLGGGKTQEARLVTTVRRRVLSERNKNFVMWICYPLPLLLVLFPLHLTLLLLEGLFMSAVRRDISLLTEVYLGSCNSLWRHRRLLLTCRSSTQRRRSIQWRQFFAVFTLFPHKLRMLWKHGIPQIRR